MTEVFEDDPPPAWLHEQVGGHIDLVPGQPHKVVVSEDARVLGLPVNELAAARLGDVLGTVDGMMCGNVVIIELVQ
jgi:hypothetical protein